MAVNLTSTWIPLSLLSVLSLYMFVLFQRERREAAAYEAAGGDAAHGYDPNALMAHVTAPNAPAAHSHDAHVAAPAAHEPHGHTAPAAASHDHAPAAHAAPVAPENGKTSIVWRTAYLWLPLVAGFGWQGYLDIIRPMLEKAGS